MFDYVISNEIITYNIVMQLADRKITDHSRTPVFFVGDPAAHIFSFQCCVVLFTCIFCFCPMSCLSNMACVSALSILDFPFGYL